MSRGAGEQENRRTGEHESRREPQERSGEWLVEQGEDMSSLVSGIGIDEVEQEEDGGWSCNGSSCMMHGGWKELEVPEPGNRSSKLMSSDIARTSWLLWKPTEKFICDEAKEGSDTSNNDADDELCRMQLWWDWDQHPWPWSMICWMNAERWAVMKNKNDDWCY